MAVIWTEGINDEKKGTRVSTFKKYYCIKKLEVIGCKYIAWYHLLLLLMFDIHFCVCLTFIIVLITHV